MPREPSDAERRSRRRPARRASARSRQGLRARRPFPGVRAYREHAQRQLRRFRQGSALAVALAALLLLAWGAPADLAGQDAAPAPAQAHAAGDAAGAPDATDAVNEAGRTIQQLATSFYAFLPRLVLVILLVAAAVTTVRLARVALRRMLEGWPRVEAASALAQVAVYTIAAVASMSVLAGDVRAAVGSVGLLGLAASWALQTPIESFTGWLLNSFRSYYRVGDRIGVGDVFGDVYRIDVLTTTVWEAGGPGKPVSAAQATGALITFPNWEVLRSNIVNYTRDFPYVWDEVTVSVANESDLAYAVRVIQERARRELGAEMADAARRYQRLLEIERLTFDVEEVPRVYLSLADSSTACTIRYLVPVRTRRHWSSSLILAMADELAKPEHRGRILSVYPRTEIALRREWPRAQTATPGMDD